MKRVDEFPTHEKDGIRYKAGKAMPFGATVLDDDAVNFSIYSKDATGCTLVLYHLYDQKPFVEIELPQEFHIGSVWSIMVFDLNWERVEYGYRFEGPCDPAAGYRFDASHVVLDPYAKLVSGRETWHERQYPKGSFMFRGRIIREDYEWEGDVPLDIPAKDLVIYELHVRGFTNDPSSGVRNRGTFAGVVEKIPYLKELGVNCVEFMPLFEFEEFFPLLTDEHANYWGYATVNYFSPKAGYAALGKMGLAVDEMKNMVKQLHKNGIEVILDIVFNHTGEYADDGEYISFRGVDNRTYYLVDEEGSYSNLSACGNTMNCNNPIVRNFILDSLRYWVAEFHVDGFRIDEAPIFARGQDGEPMVSPPLVESLKYDPILGRTKLISEGWDPAGLNTIGRFPAGWMDWNPRTRDAVKRFAKGMASAGPDVVLTMEGSPDMFCGRTPDSSVNYVAVHDGMTLYDVCAYNHAHNEGNSYPSPMDDQFDNCSWNCGVEGQTDDAEVNALRRRQMKNMLTILMLSRGVPMIWAGDEFANTQYGNNNAFSSDSEVSWLDWGRLETYADVFAYTKRLIAFRKAHPVIARDAYATGHNSSGYPEVSWHGERPWSFDRNSPFLTFGLMYAEPAADFGTSDDCFVYLAYNAHWDEHTLELPVIPDGMRWRLVLDSGDERLERPGTEVGMSVRLPPRTSMVLLGSRR